MGRKTSGFTCSVVLCLSLVLFPSTNAISHGSSPLGGQKKQRGTQQSEECARLDRLNALEPSLQVESEGGFSEFWDHNEDQLQCAGVSAARHTIHPQGLFMPSYSNAPRIIFVLDGEGIGGVVFPGCPESFSSFQQQGPFGPSSGSRGQFGGQGSYQQSQFQGDQHQKVHHLSKGDVITLPAGVAAWAYNEGDRPLVLVILLDFGNAQNQLDRNVRRFFLAGNQQQLAQLQGGGSSGQGSGSAGGFGQSGGGNVVAGLDLEILSQSLGIDQETARKLKTSSQEQNGFIIRVERGLQIARPSWRESREWIQSQTEYGQGGWQGQGGQGSSSYPGSQQGSGRPFQAGRPFQTGQGSSWYPGSQQGGQSYPGSQQERGRPFQHGGQGSRSSWYPGSQGSQGYSGEGYQQGGQESSWNQGSQQGSQGYPGSGSYPGSQQGQGQHGQGGYGSGSQWPGSGSGQIQGRRCSCNPSEDSNCKCNPIANGVEETICSMKFRSNIGDPRKADVYSREGGSWTTLNSYKLPILSYLQLTVEKGQLRQNAMTAPHWNVNAHAIVYIIRGSARFQVVDHNGRNVLDDTVRQGQLLVVPQNFVVANQAQEDNFEWIALKTNENAIINQITGKGSAITSLPDDLLANAYGLSDQEVKMLKQNRAQESLILAPLQSQLSGRTSL